MKQTFIASLFTTLSILGGDTRSADLILLETEALTQKGGWLLDQQFMDQMGSPYLLAHGLGVPVQDAVGEVTIPTPGRYRVWVRTRDWVAPWKAPGSPGRFQVFIDDKALDTTFGTEGAPWHWQDGGIVHLEKKTKVALHDLTGFEGRCDAILFCQDPEFRPPDGGKELAKLRGKLLGWDLEPRAVGDFDLVVVGGGVAGTSCAVSAARQGLNVALIQDRPVLGGNGSSEVRVWPEGHINLAPYPRVGDIVGELIPPHPPGQGMAIDGNRYGDARKERIVRKEKNITLLLNHRAFELETKGSHITHVLAQHTHSGRRIRLAGKFFVDCTGDGVIGAWAGADNEVLQKGNMGVTNPWSVGAVQQNEPQLQCLCKDLDPWSFDFKAATKEQPFPRCPWAIDMSKLAFPGRKNYVGQWPGGKGPLANLGRWFWESGSGKDPIDDMEWIRDYNFRAMYGAWDTLKNVDKLYPNHRLKWAAFIAGKRESRRLLGDVIVTADHFRKGTKWPDPAFPCTWHIDIHHPDPKFEDSRIEEPFISRATDSKEYHYKGPYWAPYRCLYSRNIDNLFMAGRDISVSHDGLGAVRVMRTCGMMGETIGKAAWIAVRHNTTPRGVYEDHLPLLKELMQKHGVMRRESLTGELKLPTGVTLRAGRLGVDPATIEGIVIDDSSAELEGDWKTDGKLSGFVGQSYQYSWDKNASAQFPIHVEKSATYEVRVSWQPHSNRAKSLPIRVRSADGEKLFRVNQTRTVAGENGFQSLGTFRFESSRPGAVIYEVKGAKGVVHIDAVQVVLPRESIR